MTQLFIGNVSNMVTGTGNCKNKLCHIGTKIKKKPRSGCLERKEVYEIITDIVMTLNKQFYNCFGFVCELFLHNKTQKNSIQRKEQIGGHIYKYRANILLEHSEQPQSGLCDIAKNHRCPWRPLMVQKCTWKERQSYSGVHHCNSYHLEGDVWLSFLVIWVWCSAIVRNQLQWYDPCVKVLLANCIYFMYFWDLKSIKAL